MYDKYCSHKQDNINAHLNNPELTKQMRKELKDFLYDYTTARKLSVPSQEAYVRSLGFFGQYLADKHYSTFKQAKENDLKEYLREPYPRNHKKKSESILVWIKSSMKVFYRWLLLGKVNRPRREDKYPELVNWIEVGIAKGKKLTDKDLITDEDFMKMLDAVHNLRDKAFLHLLYETGCRLGELLNVKIEDVHFDSDKTYFYVTRSKTEARTIFIFDSARDLLAWINHHPQRNNPKAYLFTRLSSKNKKLWEIHSAYNIVRRAAERAGIEKRIWCHLFRHSAATADARRGMPMDLMQMKFGWSHDSRMPYRYMHKNPEDLRRWEESQRGIGNNKPVDSHAPKKCPRCEKLNDWTSKFCNCGQALDAQAIMEKEAALVKAGELNELRLKKLEEKVFQG